jgi:acetylornithine deacetylase
MSRRLSNEIASAVRRKRSCDCNEAQAVAERPVGYALSIMPDLPVLDPIRFTRELVAIDSTTYYEGAVGDFLAGFLEGRGWQVEKTAVPQPAESGTAGDRWNVYAGIPDGTPELVFSTHMDTVPPYIPFREDEEFMYGRGVCDAKGIVAAQCAAGEALRAEGFRIGLLFVAGEERDSAGAIVANESPKGNRFLVNGEPTDNRLALASKGSLRCVIRSTGKMAHSAYPELGESGIHKLVAVMTRLLAMELPVTEDFGSSTLNIGLIQGGRAPNVLADAAEAQVLIRLVGDSAPIRAAVLEAAQGLADVDFTLEIPFVRLRGVEGLPSMIAKYTTDIPKLSNWGEPLLLGPGSIHVAHTPNERLAKNELFEAVELYIRIAKQLLA